MVMAVVKNNLVENVIIIHESEIESMAKTLDAELIEASQYGLAIGDLRTPNGWTRNIKGEQTLLKPQDIDEFSNYLAAVKHASNLEWELEINTLKTYSEITQILTGEVKENEILE